MGCLNQILPDLSAVRIGEFMAKRSIGSLHWGYLRRYYFSSSNSYAAKSSGSRLRDALDSHVLPGEVLSVMQHATMGTSTEPANRRKTPWQGTTTSSNAQTSCHVLCRQRT